MLHPWKERALACSNMLHAKDLTARHGNQRLLLSALVCGHYCSVDCVPLGRWKEAIEMYRENHRDNKILLTNYPEDVDACM